MPAKFFPDRFSGSPKIYAYSDSHEQFNGLLKIGYTTQGVVERVRQQYPTSTPGKPRYKILLDEPAIRNDGSTFRDTDVHKLLKLQGFPNPGGEWFRCDLDAVRAAISSLRVGNLTVKGRPYNFSMRPEQEWAVKRTAEYFRSFKEKEKGKTPHFLWNAKMRFGKTFAAYNLALKMGWKRLLVLTFQPVVENAWETDLITHQDFADWQFIKRDGLQFTDADKSKPYVCFGSFQDFLGKNAVGGIKPQNEWVHTINWDCVIIDEYHYGAWRDSAKELFEGEEESEAKKLFGDGLDDYDEGLMPITTEHYLYLSGTPFRAITSGEFIEEQIYNWTYSDEQSAKEEWKGSDNPYLSLPRMVLMTYRLPDSISEVAMEGEFNEFDLNVFFSAEGEGESASFRYECEVQKWLNLIRGQNLEITTDNLKLGVKKPSFPFSDTQLLALLNHTFWFLPSVASCYAMKNLLQQPQNTFFRDYSVVVTAGSRAGSGARALDPVLRAMDNPLISKTITLSCGKLTSGVSVKPWAGILMLRNCSSPETYFQAAFRVQTPWEIDNLDEETPNKKEIVKKECYVFDFAPDRALRLISEYSCRLNLAGNNPEEKVEEFIKFLPVLAYDGSSMKQIDACGVLDYALSGTSATLLARRWESTLLVNVDNSTLERLIENEKAMRALMSIEGFRSLNQDIEAIISKSDWVNEIKEKANNCELTNTERNKISDEEKKYKDLRKKIQEKLVKFATRIPVFMYLTDYRERTLRDVITQLEPGLFKKVTGLSREDFDLLVSLKVFNGSLMNDAVYKFKRYEDESLCYTGINKHEGEYVGLFDKIISAQEIMAK